jgi:hypothetical protein
MLLRVLQRKGTYFVTELLCQEEPMKSFARLSLLGSGLGLFFLTAAPSFATVVGTLNTGGNGTVTVTPTGITFTENDTKGSSTEVGAGTTVTFSGGSVLAIGDPVNIGGGATITPATLPTTITFPSEPTLSITLDSFGPGSSNTDCTGLSNGQSCSPSTPFGPSPIILTAVGSGTSALLFVSGTATDGSGVSSVIGNFSANIAGETPAELASSSSFTTTYSGQLTITASQVPEPRQIGLVILAGLLMGLVVKRRKSEV